MFLMTLANIVDQQILHRHSPSFRIGVLLGVPDEAINQPPWVVVYPPPLNYRPATWFNNNWSSRACGFVVVTACPS
jgi:hypothetical protein